MPSEALKKLSIANSPTKEGSQAAARIAEVRQNVNNGATPAEARRIVRGIEAPKTPVITPETLSAQPTPTLTPPATPTEAPALQADLAVQAEDAFTKQQEQKAEMASTAKTSALDDYLKAIRETQGETALTSQLYGQAGGVDDITLELNDINDQIRKEQRALDLAKRSITEKGGGLASGAAAEIGNLERVSLQKQADLSIIQMGIQGRYDSAKTIADRAVAAQLEKQKILNEALRVNYEDKKAEWTTAEQREFETLLGNRERAYEEKQQQLRDIKDFALSALQAGAPVSSVQRAMGAKTLDEAMSLVGSYLRPKPAAASTKAPDLQNFGTSDNPVWKQWNPATSSWEDVSGVSNDPQSNAFANALASNDIENVTSILNNSAIGSVVGPSALARTSPGLWGATKRFFAGALAGGAAGAGVGALAGGVGAIPGAIIGALGTGVVNATRGSMDQLTGDRQNFIGTVENMRSELTKDKLAQAKGEGVTFGALSDGERGLIANAATKIGNWAITDNGQLDGKVIGYDIDEESFKREVDVINYFKKLDAVLQGADPASIGVIQQADGTLWVANSDGSLSELKRQ